jgi:ribose/xylose/arabinose/galactoside ABC-type transport system permease subunit
MTRWIPESSLIAVFAALVAGTLIGLANGLCVAKIGMNAFILTLIMQMFCDGISLIATDSVSIGDLSEGYIAIGKGSVLGIP